MVSQSLVPADGPILGQNHWGWEGTTLWNEDKSIRLVPAACRTCSSTNDWAHRCR